MNLFGKSRTSAVLLGSMMVFVLAAFAACGDDDSDSSPTPAPTVAAPNAAATTTDARPSATVAATATAPATAAPTTSTSPLDGAWVGTWKASATSDTGTVRIQWKQTGSQLAGTIIVSNTPCVANGTITGLVNGNAITFGAVQSVTTIAYTGTLSGNTIAGTYQADASCGNATGSWTATKG